MPTFIRKSRADGPEKLGRDHGVVDIGGGDTAAQQELATPWPILPDVLENALHAKDPKTRAAALCIIVHSPEKYVPILSGMLEHKSNKTRQRVAEAMCRFGSLAVAAIPALVTALDDEHKPVVKASAQALASMGRKAVPALMKALATGTTRLRQRAAETLAVLGPDVPVVTASLVQALGDESPAVHTTAAKALAKIGADALPALTQALGDIDPQMRHYAAMLIVQVGPAAIPMLEEKLRATNAMVRAGVAEALRDMGSKAVGASPALSLALSDVDPRVKLAAAEALLFQAREAKLADSLHADSLPAVAHALADEDRSVRRKVAEVLGSFGNTAASAVPALVQAMCDVDANVRKASADSLGMIGVPAVGATRALIDAVGDGNRSVACAACHALERITQVAAARLTEELGPGSVQTLAAALRDPEALVRRVAGVVLAALGPTASAAAPALGQALRDADDGVAAAAKRALTEIGTPALPVVAAAAGGRHVDAASAAADILDNLGTRAVPELVNQLIAGDLASRRQAADALRLLGSSALPATPALLAAMQGHRSVGVSASRALAEMGDAGVSALRGQLNSNDRRARDRAAEALSEAFGSEGQFYDAAAPWRRQEDSAPVVFFAAKQREHVCTLLEAQRAANSTAEITVEQAVEGQLGGGAGSGILISSGSHCAAAKQQQQRADDCEWQPYNATVPSQLLEAISPFVPAADQSGLENTSFEAQPAAITTARVPVEESIGGEPGGRVDSSCLASIGISPGVSSSEEAGLAHASLEAQPTAISTARVTLEESIGGEPGGRVDSTCLTSTGVDCADARQQQVFGSVDHDCDADPPGHRQDDFAPASSTAEESGLAHSSFGTQEVANTVARVTVEETDGSEVGGRLARTSLACDGSHGADAKQQQAPTHESVPVVSAWAQPAEERMAMVVSECLIHSELVPRTDSGAMSSVGSTPNDANLQQAFANTSEELSRLAKRADAAERYADAAERRLDMFEQRLEKCLAHLHHPQALVADRDDGDGFAPPQSPSLSGIGEREENADLPLQELPSAEFPNNELLVLARGIAQAERRGDGKDEQFSEPRVVRGTQQEHEETVAMALQNLPVPQQAKASFALRESSPASLREFARSTLSCACDGHRLSVVLQNVQLARRRRLIEEMQAACRVQAHFRGILARHLGKALRAFRSELWGASAARMQKIGQYLSASGQVAMQRPGKFSEDQAFTIIQALLRKLLDRHLTVTLARLRDAFAEAEKAAPQGRQRFVRRASLVSDNIKVTRDGLRAQRLSPADSTLHGVVCVDGMLPCTERGVYFEVEVQEALHGESLGLAIGVTEVNPVSYAEPFHTATAIPRCWTFGYGGSLSVVGQQGQRAHVQIGWQPQHLRAGDRVGLLVTREGDAVVYENRMVVVRAACGIAASVPLYGVVVLLGATMSVALVSNAPPPIESDWTSTTRAVPAMVKQGATFRSASAGRVAEARGREDVLLTGDDAAASSQEGRLLVSVAELEQAQREADKEKEARLAAEEISRTMALATLEARREYEQEKLAREIAEERAAAAEADKVQPMIALARTGSSREAGKEQGARRPHPNRTSETADAGKERKVIASTATHATSDEESSTVSEAECQHADESVIAKRKAKQKADGADVDGTLPTTREAAGHDFAQKPAGQEMTIAEAVEAQPVLREPDEHETLKPGVEKKTGAAEAGLPRSAIAPAADEAKKGTDRKASANAIAEQGVGTSEAKEARAAAWEADEKEIAKQATEQDAKTAHAPNFAPADVSTTAEAAHDEAAKLIAGHDPDDSGTVVAHPAFPEAQEREDARPGAERVEEDAETDEPGVGVAPALAEATRDADDGQTAEQKADCAAESAELDGARFGIEPAALQWNRKMDEDMLAKQNAEGESNSAATSIALEAKQEIVNEMQKKPEAELEIDAAVASSAVISGAGTVKPETEHEADTGVHPIVWKATRAAEEKTALTAGSEQQDETADSAQEADDKKGALPRAERTPEAATRKPDEAELAHLKIEQGADAAATNEARPGMDESDFEDPEEETIGEAEDVDKVSPMVAPAVVDGTQGSNQEAPAKIAAERRLGSSEAKGARSASRDLDGEQTAELGAAPQAKTAEAENTVPMVAPATVQAPWAADEKETGSILAEQSPQYSKVNAEPPAEPSATREGQEPADARPGDEWKAQTAEADGFRPAVPPATIEAKRKTLEEPTAEQGREKGWESAEADEVRQATEPATAAAMQEADEDPSPKRSAEQLPQSAESSEAVRAIASAASQAKRETDEDELPRQRVEAAVNAAAPPIVPEAGRQAEECAAESAAEVESDAVAASSAIQAQRDVDEQEGEEEAAKTEAEPDAKAAGPTVALESERDIEDQSTAMAKPEHPQETAATTQEITGHDDFKNHGVQKRLSEQNVSEQAQFKFDSGLVSEFVVVSADGLAALHTRGDKDYGVVFFSAHIPKVEEGLWYFEVRVDKLRPTAEGEGLGIGVTSHLPSSFGEPYEIGMDVPSSWSFGYNGCAVLTGQDGSAEEIRIGWHPKNIKQGTTVGLLITDEGEVIIFENGEEVACTPQGREVPVGVPLYPFVDILGNAAAVSVVPDARPPPPPVDA